MVLRRACVFITGSLCADLSIKNLGAIMLDFFDKSDVDGKEDKDEAHT